MAITSGSTESKAEKAERERDEDAAIEYLSMTDKALEKDGLTRQRADALAEEATSRTFVNDWLRENAPERAGGEESPVP